MKRFLWGLGIVAQLAGLAWIAVSYHPHWVRAALFTVIETSDRNDFSWEPGHAPSWYRSDPPESYRAFEAEAKAAAQGATEMESDLALMGYASTLGKDNRGEPLSALSLSEMKGQILQGRKPNCAHYSWILLAFLGSLGREARIVGLDGSDGLGGNGHAVIEVWLESHRKWMMLDPTNTACFLKDGAPLGLLELRDILYAGQDGQLEIRQGNIYETPKSELVDFYRSLIKDIHLSAGDLASQSERPYGFLSFLRSPLSCAPRPVKGILSNLFGKGDLRVHFLDRHATPYEPARFSALLRGVALLTLGLVLALPLGLACLKKGA